MTRLQQLLVSILVIQLILTALVFWPRPAATAVGGPLLGELKAEDITSLTIADDQGKSIVLARKAGGWTLPDAGDYTVDSTKISPIVEKLVGLKSNRLVTQTAASHTQLQVSEGKFVRRLDIGTAGGQTKTLLLGSSAGGSSTHARVAGSSEVYLVSDLSTWSLYTDPASWIDTQYLNVPTADVVAFALGNANGQWSFSKDASGTWTMDGLAAGEQLNASALTGLISQVATLRMSRPLGKEERPEYGLAKPVAIVTLKTSKDNQEKTYTLTIGAQDATDNSYVAKSSESPYYVRVAEYSAKDLVEKKREGFLQLPPTAQPAPGTPTPQP